jgi:hypothetical protein
MNGLSAARPWGIPGPSQHPSGPVGSGREPWSLQPCSESEHQGHLSSPQSTATLRLRIKARECIPEFAPPLPPFERL